MHVRHLSIGDFRSYAAAELALEPGVTTLVGLNGQGKTNLVEAIGYVASLSSHRVSSDQRSSRSTGHHIPGVHSRPECDGDVPFALELVSQLQKRIARLAGCSDGAQRVVLVDGRDAEDPDHTAGG